MADLPTTVRDLSLQPFVKTRDAMRTFTDARDQTTPDELWIVEHPPVYTQGVTGKPEHLLSNPANIEVVSTDRGGQITYHGPGQVVVYCLVDLRRKPYGVREFVRRLESAVVAVLAVYGVVASGRVDAPGVYVDGRKIASLGLKVRTGCTYHGIALNVDMDLSPFENTNPCGLLGMKMTQCRDVGISAGPAEIARQLTDQLKKVLST